VRNHITPLITEQIIPNLGRLNLRRKILNTKPTNRIDQLEYKNEIDYNLMVGVSIFW